MWFLSHHQCRVSRYFSFICWTFEIKEHRALNENLWTYPPWGQKVSVIRKIYRPASAICSIKNEYFHKSFLLIFNVFNILGVKWEVCVQHYYNDKKKLGFSSAYFLFCNKTRNSLDSKIFSYYLLIIYLWFCQLCFKKNVAFKCGLSGFRSVMIASKRLTFLFLGVLLPEVDKWLNSAGDCCRDGLRALIWTLTKRAQQIHSSKSSKSVVMLWKVRWSDPSSWSEHMFFNSFGSMYIWLCLNTHWTLPYTSSLIRRGFIQISGHAVLLSSIKGIYIYALETFIQGDLQWIQSKWCVFPEIKPMTFAFLSYRNTENWF